MFPHIGWVVIGKATSSPWLLWSVQCPLAMCYELFISVVSFVTFSPHDTDYYCVCFLYFICTGNLIWFDRFCGHFHYILKQWQFYPSWFCYKGPETLTTWLETMSSCLGMFFLLLFVYLHCAFYDCWWIFLFTTSFMVGCYALSCYRVIWWEQITSLLSNL